MLRKGIPVSPGVAVARAFCVDGILARRETSHLDVAALAGEVRRFEEAVQAAAADLDAIVERVARQVGEEEAAIFRSHRLLLRDVALVGKVRTIITTRRVDAATALHVSAGLFVTNDFVFRSVPGLPTAILDDYRAAP